MRNKIPLKPLKIIVIVSFFGVSARFIPISNYVLGLCMQAATDCDQPNWRGGSASNAGTRQNETGWTMASLNGTANKHIRQSIVSRFVVATCLFW